jgi:hypothetical protein
VDLQQDPRGIVDGRGVVGRPGLVGGPDLDERRAARGHELGEPVRPADLDELAPGHGHRAAGGQPEEHEEQGASVVVDDEGVLGAGELDEQAPDPLATAAPLAGREVEFDVPVGQGGLARRVCGGRVQWGTSEVGVEQDAGGVDHRCRPGEPEPGGGLGGDGFRIGLAAGLDDGPGLVDRGSGDGDRQAAG